LIFRDVDGKPALREERPKAKCPVKGCKGTAEQYKAKSDGRLFWKCGTCGNMFDDAGGKPVIREKKGKNEAV
jgi:Zn-finger protein